MLNADELYSAEGGNAGLAIQTGATFFGLTILAVSNPAIANAWRSGSLKAMQWGSIAATAFAAHYVGQQASIQAAGDRTKWNNHWAAYAFVKSQNRWEGRKILSKAPMTY